jgi:hypothetical protein
VYHVHFQVPLRVYTKMDENILKDIKRRFREELTATLTTGRDDDGLDGLSNVQVEEFWRSHEKEIDERVLKMYRIYEDDGDLDELRGLGGENDWYREFLYETGNGKLTKIYKDAVDPKLLQGDHSRM